jgi:hypothetical protein
MLHGNRPSPCLCQAKSLGSRACTHAVHGRALLVSGLHHGADLGLLPHPQHQVPLGRAALPNQDLAVAAERQADVLLRPEVRRGVGCELRVGTA